MDKASKQDPCMFMKKGLVVLAYVDDVMFFGTIDAIIYEMIANLKKDFGLRWKRMYLLSWEFKLLMIRKGMQLIFDRKALLIGS